MADELEVQIKTLGTNVAEIKAKADKVEGIESKIGEITTKAAGATTLAQEAKTVAEAAATKAEAVSGEVQSFKQWQVTKDERDAENQKVINKHLAEGNRIQMKQGGGEMFEDLLSKALQAQEGEIKEFATKKRSEIVLDLKAVGDMSFGTNFSTAANSINTVRPGMVALPNRKVHIRQLVPTGTMDGGSFTFIKELAGEGAIAPVAEGATKPQFDLDFQEKTVNNEYIAGWLRMSKKLLDDVKGMASYLNTRLPELLLRAEDAQLLNGNGTSPNLSGITATGNNVAASDTATPPIERILDSIALLEDTHERNATGILIRPKAYMDFFKNKSAGSGEYDLPKNVTYVNGQLYIGGVPIFASTAATANQYIVGDWQNGAQILVREAPSIVFAYEDGTNIRENKVTVRIEERIAFPIYGNNFFVVGALTTVV